MKIIAAQVRGNSGHGENTVTESITAPPGSFKPGSIAHVFLTGWSFKFTYGDHNILELGMYLQRFNETKGDWEWAHDFPVDKDGGVVARYVTFIGSENRDNPFTVLINYAIIGE